MFDQEIYFENLHTLSIGRRIYYFESVDSTNSFIINEDWKRGAIAVAENQTGGKGRSGRGWVTIGGNASFSFAVTHIDKSLLMPLNIIIGFAVCDVLRKYTSVYLKWPNDCVAGGRKICGILLETSFEGDKLEKLAIGVGINLYDKFVPKDVGLPITSLETLGVSAEIIKREEIIANILNRCEELITLLNYESIEIDKLWPQYSANIGKEISVTISGNKKVFIEKRIDKSGSLIVENMGGEERTITSEEVGYDFSG